MPRSNTYPLSKRRCGFEKNDLKLLMRLAFKSALPVNVIMPMLIMALEMKRPLSISRQPDIASRSCGILSSKECSFDFKKTAVDICSSILAK